MKTITDKEFLFLFMKLFDINRFEVISENKENIHACVGYPNDGSIDYDEDEETQEILWEIQKLSNKDDVLRLIEFLCENQLMHSDNIKVSYSELEKKISKDFSWDKIRTENAINNLLNVKVDMIDDNELTDFFFVHF